MDEKRAPERVLELGPISNEELEDYRRVLTAAVINLEDQVSEAREARRNGPARERDYWEREGLARRKALRCATTLRERLYRLEG